MWLSRNFQCFYLLPLTSSQRWLKEKITHYQASLANRLSVAAEKTSGVQSKAGWLCGLWICGVGHHISESLVQHSCSPLARKWEEEIEVPQPLLKGMTPMAQNLPKGPSLLKIPPPPQSARLMIKSLLHEPLGNAQESQTCFLVIPVPTDRWNREEKDDFLKHVKHCDACWGSGMTQSVKCMLFEMKTPEFQPVNPWEV